MLQIVPGAKFAEVGAAMTPAAMKTGTLASRVSFMLSSVMSIGLVMREWM